MSGAGGDDTDRHETYVVDVDAFEEFDLDSSIVPSPEPSFAQGSETHDRAAVARDLAEIAWPELDAMLLAYIHDLEPDDDDDAPPLPPTPPIPRRTRRD